MKETPVSCSRTPGLKACVGFALEMCVVEAFSLNWMGEVYFTLHYLSSYTTHDSPPPWFQRHIVVTNP